MARDAAALQAGGYRIEKTTLVDMFPQTYHIETVMELTKQ
jgi:23S rRNA (uracil1939-C5)-methyltransferase